MTRAGLRPIARLAGLLVCAAPPHATAEGAPPASAAVEDLAPLLEPIREEFGLPALAGAIVAGDRVVALGATGVRRRGSRIAVTVDDRWHLGSCTKAMTATLAARFVERGTLGWDTRIGETLAGEIDPGYRDVTLEQLLAHRAGAPGALERRPIWSWLWSHDGSIAEERARLVATILAEAPEAKPGSEFLYSNAGYVIVGAMLESKAGESWETLVARELFQPLGMTSAGFGAPGAPGEASEPWGHQVEDDRVTPIEPGARADNPPAVGPAGTVHASLRDWAKFVALHLAGARGESDFLETGTFQKLHTPPAGGDYALGWLVVERDWAGGRVLTHLGSNTGWVAVTWLAPRRDFAVLVATNQGGSRAEKAADRAAWALIQHQMSAGGRAGG